jgi:glyoxylase-like metal-dependent hydrolase (beta-lactamase superfamily II)
MAFLTEPAPPRGVMLPVIAGVHRVVAANSSVMTYHGTNTFLIDQDDGGVTVLDPGPNDAAHVAAVIAGGAGRIARILVSHAHGDHVGAAAALRAETGAPVFGARSGGPVAYDHLVRLGDVIAGMQALFTPGHASDHVCFERADGVVFTGDHVMGWASSVVNPPDGDMAAYCDSLELMLARPHRLYLCGHGPEIAEPHAHVRALLDHRRRREEAIAHAVRRRPSDTHTLMERLYSKIDPMLKLAAERNVLAHLLKLQQEGKVAPQGALWHWVGAGPQGNTDAHPV